MSINESDAIKLYHDTKRGYWGKTKTMKKYREMLNKVYALQRHREVNSKMLKKQYKREGAIRPFFSVQVDLADFPKYQNPLNKNYRYFMVVIDVFSRYLWVLPLKSKKNLHIPLRQIFQQMKKQYKKTPENMTGDNEFDTNELKSLAKECKFRWWFGDPHEKFRTGIVERVIRTIRNLLKRYLTQNDTTKYIDVLDDFVYNYNHTEHSHIHTKPAVAIKSGQTFPKPMDNDDIQILRVGDWVRVLMERKRAFDKGDKPYYSKELYEILKKDGNKYIVKDIKTGKTLKKTYYIHQLLHIKDVIKNNRKEGDNVGYDAGIEHKTKQRKNKRALKGIDINNIIDPEERKQSARDLHYDDEDFFHDKPLPSKMSDKQLNKKQEQLEEKIESDSDDDDEPSIDEQIKDLRNKIKKNKGRRNTVKRLMNKIKNLQNLKSIKNKKKHVDKIAPIRRSRRQRNKPKRYGYDK